MGIRYAEIKRADVPAQIADEIRSAILEGRLVVDERLPSETELAERFGVSRPSVREGLKRLAAQNLIRTERGAAGGAFVNRISWSEAHDALVTTATLLIGMNDIPFKAAAEARFTLERACLRLAAERRTDEHSAAMRAEIEVQSTETLTDEAFCASDVRFHRALVDAAGNPVISFQMAGVVEAMQPLMNMITYRARDRARIVELHTALLAALTAHDAERALAIFDDLHSYTLELAARRP